MRSRTCSTSTATRGRPPRECASFGFLMRLLPGSAQVVARRIGEVLPDTQILFGRGDGSVPQAQLDLLKRGPPTVREFRVSAPEVVACEARHADAISVMLH